MTKKQRKSLVDYWAGSAEQDWLAYQSLRKAKRYAHALFFLHLTFEKLLKAVIVAESAEHAPHSHNLSYLLGKTSLPASERLVELLTEVSKFNMQTRYPDEKLAFYSSIDLKTSQYWHKLGMEIRTWLLNSVKES